MAEKLNSSIYFAPLQSYTTLPYYQTFCQLFKGVHKYFTPFYRKNKRGDFEYEQQLISYPGIHIIPQVLTNSAEDLVLFGKDMMQRGFEEINLNVGCPFPMVANKHLGSGLLPYVDEVENMLEGFFRHNLKIQLSIKTRLGWADSEDIISLLKLINQFPVHEVILHPRLGIQKYSGKPDWDAFGKMTKMQTKMLVGNGDINSINELQSLMDRFPEINSWMIGRGLLTNPYMFEGDIEPEEKRKQLFKFHDLFYDKLKEFGYMENQILNHLKIFWEFPIRNFIGGTRVYRKLRKAGKMEEYLELMKKLLDLEQVVSS